MKGFAEFAGWEGGGLVMDGDREGTKDGIGSVLPSSSLRLKHSHGFPFLVTLQPSSLLCETANAIAPSLVTPSFLIHPRSHIIRCRFSNSPVLPTNTTATFLNASLPSPCFSLTSTSLLRNCLTTRNPPVKFVSRVLFHCARDISCIGAGVDS